MAHREVVPEGANSPQRHSDIRAEKANAQCILYIKRLSWALVLVATVCIVNIAVLSWHIVSADLKAELTQIATPVEQLIATTIKNQEQTVQENDTVYSEDMAKLFLAMAKLESELKEIHSALTEIVTNVENFNATIENQVQIIQENDEDRGMIWSALRNIESGWQERNATHVSFSARLGHDKQYTSKETLVFKTILNNDGDAYDANTGIFTAPVDGKYWFSASISVFHAAYANVQIMKNNAYTVIAIPDRRGYSDNNYETATVSTVMDLKSGDTVYCRWAIGTRSGSMFTVYGTAFNSFSGALLTQY